MVKVFYVGGSAATTGMLRAVLLDDLEEARLAESQEFAYLGTQFPRLMAGGPPATIIEISERQAGSLQVGFHRAEQQPLQFEDVLCAIRN